MTLIPLTNGPCAALCRLRRRRHSPTRRRHSRCCPQSAVTLPAPTGWAAWWCVPRYTRPCAEATGRPTPTAAAQSDSPPVHTSHTTHLTPVHPLCHPSSLDRPFPATHPPAHLLPPMCPQGPVPARRNRRQVRVARPDTPAADRSARLHRRGLQLRRAPSRRRTLPAPARTHMALGQAGIAACQTPPLCSARARLLRLLRVHLAAPGGRRCVAPTGRDDGEGRGRRASPTRRAHAVERACRSPCRRLRWPGRQSCRPWQWRQRHHQQQ